MTVGVLKWGSHEDEDVRAAIATCLLEHLLEYHFKLLLYSRELRMLLSQTCGLRKQRRNVGSSAKRLSRRMQLSSTIFALRFVKGPFNFLIRGSQWTYNAVPINVKHYFTFPISRLTKT
jgi:hypothetical protein